MSCKQYKVIDCHCDTLTELKDGENLFDNQRAVSLHKVQAYGGYAQLFAVWIADDECAPFQTLMTVVDRFYHELNTHGESMMQVLSAGDFENAFKNQKVGAMLTLENGKAIEGSLANLRNIYRLGVRAMTLTWNGANEIADGIFVENSGGLTAFGKSVVSEMNQLGMIIDVSHLSEQGFYDVLSLSEVPVMASHSNSLSMCSHVRNLTDEQIKLLANSGGVMGLNLYPVFLTDSGRAELSDCLRHIEHILRIGGEECLTLGSDFDGFLTESVKGLSGPDDYVSLFELLEKQGYPESLIEKITYKNFLRFAKEVLH